MENTNTPLAQVIAGAHMLVFSEDLMDNLELQRGIAIETNTKGEFWVIDISSYCGMRIEMQNGNVEPFVYGLYINDYYKDEERKLYNASQSTLEISNELNRIEKINQDAFYDIFKQLEIIAATLHA